MTARGAFLRSRDGHRGDPARHVLRRDPPEPLHPRGLRGDARGGARGALPRARRAGVAGALHRRPTRARSRSRRRRSSPLETALLEAQPWEPLVAEAIERALEEAPIDLKLEPLGVVPAQRGASRRPRRAAAGR